MIYNLIMSLWVLTPTGFEYQTHILDYNLTYGDCIRGMHYGTYHLDEAFGEYSDAIVTCEVET